MVNFTEIDKRGNAGRKMEIWGVALSESGHMVYCGVRQQTLRCRSFVRGKRNYSLEAKWRTSKNQHYLLALKFMNFKRSNKLCQKELQEHSILGTSQDLRQGRLF